MFRFFLRTLRLILTMAILSLSINFDLTSMFINKTANFVGWGVEGLLEIHELNTLFDF